jgi:hypothetical protein
MICRMLMVVEEMRDVRDVEEVGDVEEVAFKLLSNFCLCLCIYQNTITQTHIIIILYVNKNI